MSISFGVAGTGWVAAEYLKWISRHPDGKVAGVVSRNPDRAERVLETWGIDGKVFESYETMVNSPDVDAVVLCSTPDVRPAQAVYAAERDKHLIIEKPVALDRQSLHDMAASIGKRDICTSVSFVLRWNPLFDTIKSLIGVGALGSVFMAEVDYWHHFGAPRWDTTRALGGSSLLTAGCHAVDALRYFAGEVRSVTAVSHRHPDTVCEFDPNVLAMLTLKNGGMGKVSSLLHCRTPYKFSIRLHGDQGTMIDNRIYSRLFPGQTDYVEIPTILPDSGDVAHHPFKEEIADFIRSAAERTATKCDFRDAFRSMEVCFAIDESMATGGKTVMLS